MNKEGWPPFPYGDWTNIKKWNMSSLEDIASHLHGKTSHFRERSSSGIKGTMSDVEKQMYQHVSDLEQQVFHLEDAVHALLQIIDDNRPSQRVRRFLRSISEGIRRCKERMQQSTVYWILGLLGAGTFLFGLIKYAFHFFRK